MKIIDKAWLSYERKIIPTTAPRVQRTESRRAFYAGAAAVFGGLVANVSPGDGEPTAEDMAVAAGIQHELDEWIERIERGEV